jgi:growth arrest-specific protein 8
MDIETLKKEIGAKKEKLLEERIKRNYIQMEKEMIYDFYSNTRKELQESRNMILIHDHEIEQSEEDHKTEMTVYTRKLQYLEHEHQTKDTKGVETRAQNAMADERKDFIQREDAKKKDKKNLVQDYRKNESKNIEDIKALEEKLAGFIDAEVKALKTAKEALIGKYEEKLENLRRDLDLRIKVEIHELEERKNKHINDLRATHRKQYEKVKESYNTMTKQQLSLIKQTTGDKEEIDKRAEEVKEQIKGLLNKINISIGPKADAEKELKSVEKTLGTYTRVNIINNVNIEQNATR